jgi:hypothetical protein
VDQALVESPQDAQLVPLERLVRQRLEQSQQAQNLLEQGQGLLQNKSFDEALRTLESAHSLDEHNVLIRANYIEAILGKASAIIDADLAAAEKLVEGAFGLDATNASVKNMRVLVSDRKRSSAIDQYLSKARELQAMNEVDLALAEVEKGLVAFPGEARLVQLQSSLEGAHKQSELRKDRVEILSLRKRLDASDDDTLLGSLFDETMVLARKHPADEQIQTIASEIGKEMSRRQAAAVVTPPRGKVSDSVLAGVSSDQAEPTGSTEIKPEEDTARPAPWLPHNLRVPLFIALAAVLIIGGVVITRSLGKHSNVAEPPVHAVVPQPPPPPDLKTVGNAVARSSTTLLKDPVDSGINVGTLNLDDPVDILEQVPASTNSDEWVFVQPSGQTANRGYIRLGNLDRVQTGDHHFNVLFALAWIIKSTDSADVKSRLESLPLADSEANDIYFGLAQGYVHLAELTVGDKKVSRAALGRAQDYLKRAESPETLEAVQKLQATIQRLLNQSRPDPQIEIAKLLASANAAYQKGMMLEASDADNALKQYSQATRFCDQILNHGSNAEAETLRKNALQAAVTLAKKMTK